MIFDAEIVMDRLKVPGIKKIKSAKDFAEIEKNAISVALTPTVYVIDLGYTNTDIVTMGSVDFEEYQTFGVITAVRFIAKDSGKDLLRIARQLVRNRLQNWVPEEGYSGCRLNGGNLLNINDKSIYYLDKFKLKNTECEINQLD